MKTAEVVPAVMLRRSGIEDAVVQDTDDRDDIDNESVT